MQKRLPTAAAVTPLLLALACLEPRAAHPPGHMASGGSGAPGGAGGATGVGGDSGAGGSGGGAGGAGVCNDGPAIVDVNGPCIDLGAAEPGVERTVPVPVRNASREPLELCPTIKGRAFSLEASRLVLPPLASTPLAVLFRPSDVGSFESQLVLAPCAPCTHTPPASVCLKGLGAESSFVVAPSPIVFRPEPANQQACQEIRIHNSGNVPLRVQGVDLDDGLTRTEGTFELRLGTLMSEEIPPGGFATFQLCFRPAKGGVQYSGYLLVRTGNQAERVLVTAGGTSCFAAEPTALDLGVATPGQALDGTVALRDVCGHATLLELRVEPAIFELNHEPLPAHLDADGLPVGVRFYPRDTQGVASARLIGIIDTVNGPQTIFSVPLVARSAPP